MKKIFLFTAMAAMAISCSSDSDSGSSVLVSSILFTDSSGNTTYSIAYDGSKRVSQIVRNGPTIDNTFTFAYDSNSRMTSITKTGDSSGLTTLGYDSNGRLSSVIIDGDPAIPVTYSNGTYTISSLQYTFNSRGDLATVFSSELFTFNYDTGKKGSFNNAKGNYQLLGLILESPFLFIGSEKPLTGITATPDNTYVFTNTYDEDGYISTTSATLGGDPNMSATYTYTE